MMTPAEHYAAADAQLVVLQDGLSKLLDVRPQVPRADVDTFMAVNSRLVELHIRMAMVPLSNVPQSVRDKVTKDARDASE